MACEGVPLTYSNTTPKLLGLLFIRVPLIVPLIYSSVFLMTNLISQKIPHLSLLDWNIHFLGCREDNEKGTREYHKVLINLFGDSFDCKYFVVVLSFRYSELYLSTCWSTYFLKHFDEYIQENLGVKSLFS